MNPSISKCAVRGEQKWRVRWIEAGKVRRAFHDSKLAADSHAAKLRGEAIGVKELLATIPQGEQEKLVILYNAALRDGRDILSYLTAAPVATVAGPALINVISELIATKKKSGSSVRYLTNLEGVLKEFARGLEMKPVNQCDLAIVENWLNSKKLVSRSCYRGRLSVLFNFAIRRGYMNSNPCERLETVKVTRANPSVMTVVEVEKALAWFKVNPRMLGWFILTTFAGLRPEEADKTSWADINFEEGWIKVERQTTKTRQRRLFHPQAMVFAWLAHFKTLGFDLSIGRERRGQLLVPLRAAVGWPVWKKDVTRHTCASYWLMATGNAEQVAESLGHSVDMLKKHYRGTSYADGTALTKGEAEKFWALRP